jgi:hypothetical protein
MTLLSGSAAGFIFGAVIGKEQAVFHTFVFLRGKRRCGCRVDKGFT